MDFAIKEGDTLPVLLVTLKDGAATAINVSGADSITFRMRAVNPAANVGVYKVNREADLNTDGTDGKVKIGLTADETDTPGTYQGEFVIDWGGGDQQTVPSDGYVSIQVSSKA